MFLSKESYALASTVVTDAYGVYLLDMNFLAGLRDDDPEENSVELNIYYIPPEKKGIPNSHKPYRISFVEDSNGGCSVRRLVEKKGRKYDRNGVRYTDETYACAATRVFFQITKSIKAKEITFEMNPMRPEVERVLKEHPTTRKFLCEEFLIRTEDRALPPLLLRFLSPGTKLDVYSNPFPEPGDIFIDTAFFDSDVVRAAPKFDTEALTGVTEEQFVLLQADELSMKAPHISSKAINRILLQWLEGKRKIELVSLRKTQPLSHSVVLEGIDPSNIISRDDALKIPSIREWWEGDTMAGFHTVIRNKEDILVLIRIGSDFCDLVDAISLE